MLKRLWGLEAADAIAKCGLEKSGEQISFSTFVLYPHSCYLDCKFREIRDWYIFLLLYP